MHAMTTKLCSECEASRRDPGRHRGGRRSITPNTITLGFPKVFAPSPGWVSSAIGPLSGTNADTLTVAINRYLTGNIEQGWPLDGLTFRGGGLPAEHWQFFTVLVLTALAIALHEPK